ncbi:glycosyltransferase family 2 protein [Leucobacter massiliensis]|uniref:Glycosyl transferase family 2 n=1 Tax=Leucobacter massiliensis TaxID=1686285 RepID=A0A2S9QKV2_9MICO|nr:glycosyltransferase family 2 protein [Leucobacter massiliensis]PRI10215.1 glycosyl transferase family 2 [Leucobacter massiliensis]
MTIDILMPYYGDPGQLQEAVKSVLAQRDPDWRLVVLDDCYPHWEAEPWVTGIDDPRVVFERNPRNLGVSGSFDRSIDLAAADYLVIMGCDDRMLPDYIGTVRRAIERFDRPEFVQPGVRIIDEHGAASHPLVDRVKGWVRPRVPAGGALLGGEPVMTTLLRGDWSYFPSICWRRDVLAKHRFSPEYEITLDLVLKTDILLEGGRLALLPEVVFEYRRHAASASSYTAKDGSRFDEERAFYRSAEPRLRAKGWPRAARAARIRLTSRLNALSKLPGALLSRDGSAIRTLARYAFAR